MKPSVARTVGMHTTPNVTAKRNFRCCLISVTIVAGSAATEPTKTQLHQNGPLPGPFLNLVRTQYKDTNHWTAKFGAPFTPQEMYGRKDTQTHAFLTMVLNNISLQLYFSDGLQVGNVPLLHTEQQRVGETGHDGKNTPGHNRTPVVPTVINTTEKKCIIHRKEDKRLLSFTDRHEDKPIPNHNSHTCS